MKHLFISAGATKTNLAYISGITLNTYNVSNAERDNKRYLKESNYFDAFVGTIVLKKHMDKFRGISKTRKLFVKLF